MKILRASPALSKKIAKCSVFPIQNKILRRTSGSTTELVTIETVLTASENSRGGSAQKAASSQRWKHTLPLMNLSKMAATSRDHATVSRGKGETPIYTPKHIQYDSDVGFNIENEANVFGGNITAEEIQVKQFTQFEANVSQRKMGTNNKTTPKEAPNHQAKVFVPDDIWKILPGELRKVIAHVLHRKQNLKLFESTEKEQYIH